MPFQIIDAHLDLAYSALTFGRDYRLEARETRRREEGKPAVERNGQTLLGWPDFQRGQVALVFATLYLSPPGHASAWENQVYRSPATCRALWRGQLDYYRRLEGDQPDMFRLVNNRAGLRAHFAEWDQHAAVMDGPDRRTHPVGLTLLMEGAEGIGAPRDLEEWWEAGVRMVGPVWAGERFCGGTRNSEGGFTREGYELLEVMAGLGLALDLSHMNERSALQALDRYEGPIIATHANARAILRQPDNPRHFSDLTIRRLVERGGIQGVLPYGAFLRPGWSKNDEARLTTLDHVLAHIDHICQIAGDAQHAALGSDFDGGWGWPTSPVEIETAADLQKLAPRLLERGYSESDTAAILGGNWRSFLERSLPA